MVWIGGGAKPRNTLQRSGVRPEWASHPPRSAAPSTKKLAPTDPDTTALIADEIYTAFERLDADDVLLAIVGSWRDTLDDAEILSLLRLYNRTDKERRPH